MIQCCRWLSRHRKAKLGFNSKIGFSTKYGSFYRTAGMYPKTSIISEELLLPRDAALHRFQLFLHHSVAS